MTTHSPTGLEAIFSSDFSSQRAQADHSFIQDLNEMSEPPPDPVHDPAELSESPLPFYSEQQYFSDMSDTIDSRQPQTPK